MESKPMTDERWAQLKDRTWFGDEQTEVAVYVDALRDALAAERTSAERQFIANSSLRAKARRQRVELERLNVHLAAARWACVQRYSAEQLVLALAGLRAENTKLRRDRDAGRRWVAVGSAAEAEELNRLERALAAAEKALKDRDAEWMAVVPMCTERPCRAPATRCDGGDLYCDVHGPEWVEEHPQGRLVRRATAGAGKGEP